MEGAEFLDLSASGTPSSPVCPRLVATGVKTGTVVERLLSAVDDVEVTVGLGLSMIGEEEEEEGEEEGREEEGREEEGGIGLAVVVMMLVV